MIDRVLYSHKERECIPLVENVVCDDGDGGAMMVMVVALCYHAGCDILVAR